MIIGTICGLKEFFQIYFGGNVMFRGEPTDVREMSPKNLVILGKLWLKSKEMLDEPKEVLSRLLVGETEVVVSRPTA